MRRDRIIAGHGGARCRSIALVTLGAAGVRVPAGIILTIARTVANPGSATECIAVVPRVGVCIPRLNIGGAVSQILPRACAGGIRFACAAGVMKSAYGVRRLKGTIGRLYRATA